ncbi:hypothetical protein KJH54_001724 [Escherichia coli]|nr:hypothetical protein [Escherichia coli]MBY8703492.1 hypothetical protein [Escherichia coli]MBY8714532.1 hypothetical protein [Escherichia coli]HAZ7282833.1 hypothetical protein [Escherichia coli]HBV0068158.1 hypothetical protein [Escherichia coli]
MSNQPVNQVVVRVACEHCCAELMSDPNSSMYEEEYDG